MYIDNVIARTRGTRQSRHLNRDCRGRSALAMTENQAIALVDDVVADINRVISSGKSDAAILKDFEALFARYADVDIMEQYALGADGRSASTSQKRAFADAFKGYISRKYGRRFRDFIGGRVEVISAAGR